MENVWVLKTWMKLLPFVSCSCVNNIRTSLRRGPVNMLVTVCSSYIHSVTVRVKLKQTFHTADWIGCGLIKWPWLWSHVVNPPSSTNKHFCVSLDCWLLLFSQCTASQHHIIVDIMAPGTTVLHHHPTPPGFRLHDESKCNMLELKGKDLILSG